MRRPTLPPCPTSSSAPRIEQARTAVAGEARRVPAMARPGRPSRPQPSSATSPPSAAMLRGTRRGRAGRSGRRARRGRCRVSTGLDRAARRDPHRHRGRRPRRRRVAGRRVSPDWSSTPWASSTHEPGGRELSALVRPGRSRWTPGAARSWTAGSGPWSRVSRGAVRAVGATATTSGRLAGPWRRGAHRLPRQFGRAGARRHSTTERIRAAHRTTPARPRRDTR